VAAIAAAVTAVVVSAGPAAPSIVGAWNDNSGGTFTFTPTGAGAYTVGVVNNGAPQCTNAHDGTITGGNGRYKGTIGVYRPNGATAAGRCEPKIGTVQITIVVAANGASASVDLLGNCATCKPQTWKRVS
jgi:hypothetical protein